MTGFRHLHDRVIAELARIRVVRGTFAAPDGTTFERDVVRNEEVVAVVPLHDDDTVTLVRQYRGPIDAELAEIPAGLCDVPGEDPADTAARELAEEAGLAAERLELIARVHPSAGFSDQIVRLYLATGLSSVGQDLQGVEEEHLTVEKISLDDVPAMIAEGQILDSKTMIGLLIAREHRARG